MLISLSREWERGWEWEWERETEREKNRQTEATPRSISTLKLIYEGTCIFEERNVRIDGQGSL